MDEGHTVIAVENVDPVEEHGAIASIYPYIDKIARLAQNEKK
jgi:hypothetical protein